MSIEAKLRLWVNSRHKRPKPEFNGTDGPVAKKKHQQERQFGGREDAQPRQFVAVGGQIPGDVANGKYGEYQPEPLPHYAPACHPLSRPHHRHLRGFTLLPGCIGPSLAFWRAGPTTFSHSRQRFSWFHRHPIALENA